MLIAQSQWGFQRLLQRVVAAWLLGAVLWSSSVAVAATVMGCCEQQQACCTLGLGPGSQASCATCVPPLSAAYAQPPQPAPEHAARAASPYLVAVEPFISSDIWRPPKISHSF
jgi:hypothetical protein